MIRKISFMLYPIIPSSIEKALKIFNLDVDTINFESIIKHDYLVSGKSINKIDILFKKIEKKKVVKKTEKKSMVSTRGLSTNGMTVSLKR